ncbi:AraC family transcriptional regulator [Roseateles sp.]|uniref:AraC family transcriptional regulator n=1 Tax=Roseateles sp. TaxID=1971397 RepID=UPI002DF9ADA7|nr:AraC family transcriptional regulator [Roseateles sp.]
MNLIRSDVSAPGGLIEGLAVLRVDQPLQRTLVAESRLSVGVRIGGCARQWRQGGWETLPRFTLTGVHCSSRTIHTSAGGVLVLAHLHPAAAAALGVDARRIVERSVDLSSLWPVRQLEALGDSLAGAPDDAARMRLLESAVAERILAGPAVDTLVFAAVDRIRRNLAEIRISALAQALGVSVDTLERRFTAGVGVSPKRYARAARLRSAVLSYAADMTLTDVAMGAGYYDQSHFVREMQRATGEAPARLLPPGRYC